MNRMSPRYKFGIWLGMRITQNVSLETQMVYSALVKSEDWNLRGNGKKKPSTT